MTAAVVAQAVGIVFVSFEYRFVATTIKWFPDFLFGNGSSVCMAVFSKSPEGENRRTSISFSDGFDPKNDNL